MDTDPVSAHRGLAIAEGEAFAASLNFCNGWIADDQGDTPNRWVERSSMLRKRELVGFALAPLPILAPVLLMFALILSDRPQDGASVLQTLGELVFWSYVATPVVGIPTHLILRQSRRSSLADYLGMTAVLILLAAALAAGAEVLMPPSPQDNPFGFSMWRLSGLTMTVIGFAAASVTASFFWFVAIRERQR